MQYPRLIGPVGQNDQAKTDNPSMWSGYHPDQPRILLGARIPLPIAQTSHVQAKTDDVSMWLGSHPDQSRVLLGARIPLPLSQTSHVQAKTDDVSMWLGQHPDLPPRNQLAKRFQQPFFDPFIPISVLTPFTTIHCIWTPFGRKR